MRYYVFLRAVNVGGAAKVDMPRLRSALAERGFIEVSTYLNSGNLLVDSDSGREDLALAVSGAILDDFALEPRMIVKTRDELRALIEANPFAGREIDRSKLIVCLLSGVVEGPRLAALRAAKGVSEEIATAGDALYIYYRDGVGRSKLTTGLIERTLGLYSTGRNLRTMESLLDK
jgi:Uncharacterized protein conserved in bacteria